MERWRKIEKTRKREADILIELDCNVNLVRVPLLIARVVFNEGCFTGVKRL